MPDGKPDADFADVPPEGRATIRSSSSAGLHRPATGKGDMVSGETFHHPERDAAGTRWEPNWEPIETYQDGEVVMLDDGDRQLLGRRDMGMWIELADGEERAQPDYQPMLWSRAPEQVKYDMM